MSKCWPEQFRRGILLLSTSRPSPVSADCDQFQAFALELSLFEFREVPHQVFARTNVTLVTSDARTQLAVLRRSWWIGIRWASALRMPVKSLQWEVCSVNFAMREVLIESYDGVHQMSASKVRIECSHGPQRKSFLVYRVNEPMTSTMTDSVWIGLIYMTSRLLLYPHRLECSLNALRWRVSRLQSVWRADQNNSVRLSARVNRPNPSSRPVGLMSMHTNSVFFMSDWWSNNDGLACMMVWWSPAW